MLNGRIRYVVFGVAAVVLVLLGYAVGSWASSRTPGDNSAEAGFARDMSTHHGQAVEMGMIAFQQSTNKDIATLGGDIALTQKGQIGVMNTWLKDWGLDINTSNPPMSWMPDGQRTLTNNLMPGMATRDEIKKLKSLQGKEFDILFCQYMLRHHLGGVHMVDGVLSEDPIPEVKELAETMKKNQTAEIATLKKDLADMGAAPL